ncbi:hypothetical protein OG259_33970 [Streptomyces sp. NBC_00250]|uniref:hypothetical protein n=1 Tax=Streptomyces sp. NBC_00250 TaxID=2903641 RepID=UPI002E2BAA51|nr:hypothetical protein [Streptomyces sp. NBC_00250]
MIPQRRAAAFSSLAVLAVLGISGCTEGAVHAGEKSGAGTVSGPTPTTSTTHTSRTLELPLDSYKMSTKDRTSLTWAQYVLAEKCMRQRGMKWPAPLTPRGENRDPNQRRYGISDATVAASYGYQLPPPPGVSRAEEFTSERRGKERLKTVDRATMNAYTGEGGSGPGCQDRARETLHMQWMFTADPVSAASHTAWVRSKNDGRVRTLDSEWSACMRASGHTQPDPLSAAESWAGSGTVPGKEGPLRAPSAAEVSMARADVTCKDKVDYIERRQAVEAGYQTAEITAGSQKLKAYWSALQRSLSTAREVTPR